MIVKAVLGNASWLIVERIARIVVGILVGASVARYLGPGKFGQLAYLLAVCSIFQSATSLGLDLVVARDLARQKALQHELLGTALVLRLGASVLGWMIFCGAVMVLRPGEMDALENALIVGACLLFQPMDLLDLWFQSAGKSRHAVKARLMALLVSSALRITMIAVGGSVRSFAIIYLVDAVLTATLLGRTYLVHSDTVRWCWNPSRAAALLRSGAPMLASALSIIVYMRVDQLLLEHFGGETQLGLYSAIIPFSQGWNIIPATICASAAPYLSQAFQQDPERFWVLSRKLSAALLLGGLVVSVAMLGISSLLVHLVLGEKYSESAPVLAVHALSNLPIFLGVAQVQNLAIRGKTAIVMGQSLAGLCASVCLNLLLVPGFGAIGAAWSSVGAQVFAVMIAMVFMDRRLVTMQLRSGGAWRDIIAQVPSIFRRRMGA